MAFEYVFWLGLIGAAIVLLLRLAGFNYIELAVLFVIISMLSLEFLRRGDKKLFTNELKHELIDRTDKIENICSQMVSNMSQDREKLKDEIRTEVKDSVDRVAAKAIDIENKINEIKKGLIAVAQGYDERMKVVESEIQEAKEVVTVEQLPTSAPESTSQPTL
ncbi:MAG TPA: hypothetical protein VJH90_02395 [archaeon]|nr:hypothetical protein [archaeon]